MNVVIVDDLPPIERGIWDGRLALMMRCREAMREFGDESPEYENALAAIRNYHRGTFFLGHLEAMEAELAGTT